MRCDAIARSQYVTTVTQRCTASLTFAMYCELGLSSLLWRTFSSLDSGLLATTIEVSISLHNSTAKPLIQNSPIQFQNNTAHCTFQSLILSNRGDMRTAISWNDSLTHSLTHKHTPDDYHIPLGLHPPRHNHQSQLRNTILGDLLLL